MSAIAAPAVARQAAAKVCGPTAIDRQFKTIDYFVRLDIATLAQKFFRMFFP